MDAFALLSGINLQHARPASGAEDRGDGSAARAVRLIVPIFETPAFDDAERRQAPAPAFAQNVHWRSSLRVALRRIDDLEFA